MVGNFNKDFVTKQRITIAVETSLGTKFQVTQERTLTNVGIGVKPIGPIKGYTFTMKPLEVKTF